MRLWRRRRSRVERAYQVPQDAVQARAESRKRLEEAREMHERATEVAAALNREGRRNHFSDMIHEALREHR